MRSRSAVEQDFHALKEVHGAGKQRVRGYREVPAAMDNRAGRLIF